MNVCSLRDLAHRGGLTSPGWVFSPIPQVRGSNSCPPQAHLIRRLVCCTLFEGDRYMCSGCGRCGEPKRTLSSEANGLRPDISLIQVETQVWTANGPEQPCGVTVSERNDPEQLIQQGR